MFGLLYGLYAEATRKVRATPRRWPRLARAFIFPPGAFVELAEGHRPPSTRVSATASPGTPRAPPSGLPPDVSSTRTPVVPEPRTTADVLPSPSSNTVSVFSRIVIIVHRRLGTNTQNEYRFLILGVGGAGKTCVLESLKTRFSPMPGLAPAQIVPTVGLNLARLEVQTESFPTAATTCVFWDLGGARGLREIWERYYAECDGVLFVMDAAADAETSEDEHAIEENETQEGVLRKVLDDSRLRGAPALVLVNKTDAVSDARADAIAKRCDDALVAAGISRHRVLKTVGTSGRGVDKGVDWLVGATVRSERAERRLAKAAAER
jgi:ADP-ribosylation factor related protein 1